MPAITYHQITHKNEIEILRGKKSHYKDFLYEYDGDTISLLHKYFDLKNSLYILAMSGDTFAGFVSCDANWWEEGGFFIREIFVSPDFQQHHIGTAFMEMCITHSKKNNAKFVVTQTAFENIPMQKLCEKIGFTEWENLQWKEGITYKLALGHHPVTT